MGRHIAVTSKPDRMVTQLTVQFSVGDPKPGSPTTVSGTAAIFTRPGFELPTYVCTVGCITIRPQLALRAMVLTTAWTHVCH